MDTIDVTTHNIIEIKDLSVKYKNFYALKNINLTIKKSEIIGIAGQSGSGKTTLLKTIAAIVKPYSGTITYHPDKKNLNIQYVFQDPTSSLDPRMNISDIITEPLLIKGIKNKKNIDTLLENAITKTGLNTDILKRYPHQLSGGQRQRVAIARAIISKPDILICDEPISSLDISISAQILNLLKDLSNEFKFTMIFVSHDISSIYYLTQKTVILYCGEILELGDTNNIINSPLHPYTKILISSILSTKKIDKKIDIVKRNTTSKCIFSNICPEYIEKCDKFDNNITKIDEHYVKCIRAEDG